MDNGIEFGGEKLKDYTKQHGIQLETTVPYTPEQDGVAEHGFRTLFKQVRTITIDYGVLKNLQPELVKGIVYLMNYTATTAIKDLTPLEALECHLSGNKGKYPSIAHIPALGCKAFVHL